ncbi:uncharacterized protein LOC113226169 [Hyposmocoma kahamanoa]|uniref:uncharacterized protein LOC113226169 n=1 Tax=Hyposmocoma kahamanoa TaxID=1477025 RepID=UPI000E6D9E03|nr:uncharacterized protein LOC113226169 [Hyposmocoma kahamanoa]
MRNRLQWLNIVELERHRAHTTLRSPELMDFVSLATGEQQSKDNNNPDVDGSLLVEISEDNIIVGADYSGANTSVMSQNYQLLQAANYKKHDQTRIYREFVVMVYPASYMGPQSFVQFMVDIGWQKPHCSSLFRAADITNRGGLTFSELLMWSAAIEPATQHNGTIAEIRCRYIFRYFDSNSDMKLEYVEFKELVAAARGSRQLSVDALSVARDADACLRQLGIQPNSQLSLTEFLRAVTELRLRGTSLLLRSPRSVLGYLTDLHDRDIQTNSAVAGSNATTMQITDNPGVSTTGGRQNVNVRPQYNVAMYSVRLHRQAQNEMLELSQFDEDAVSPSTARLITGALAAASIDVLGPTASPVEAMNTVRYFATPLDKPTSVRSTSRIQLEAKRASLNAKAAFAWANQGEEANLGALLLKLCDATRPIFAKESRLIRVSSPVYAIGDLHGNLGALLAMESAIWPSGPALAPARLLFLGDFVDRGPHGAELIAYLLAAKLQRPSGVLMIRGNHETRDIQKMFTFYAECVNKYGETEGIKIWNAINQVFDVLPLAAVVDDKIFCCHGGIPPPWVCPLITAIDKIPVPLTRPFEQSTIAWELLWNDPIKPNKMTATLALELTANEGFAANTKRGTGHVFDQNALDRFLAANRLSHVIRAHELHQSGFMCQLRGRLVSVFSSSHYCGGNNDSGVALLDCEKLRLIRINKDY